MLAPELDSLLAGLASRFAGEPGRSEEWELAAGEQGGRAAALGRGGAPAPGERIVIGVLGERIGVSPGVFAQGNASMHEALASRVVECAGEGTLCVELHAGAGFFTLPLARRFERLVAVESNAAAVADLRANLAAAGLERVRVVRRRVESAGRALARETPDVVVLDPPRSGLAPRAIEVVARLDAPRVVHLGCDPATFARDLRRLARHGYSPTFVEAFDLFPHTPHLEALALLEKAPNGQPGARDDVRADTRTPRG